MKRASEAGIKISECYKHISRDVKFIVTMVPTTEEVDLTLNREGGIFELAKKGTSIYNAGCECDDETRFSATAKERGMTFKDHKEVEIVPLLNKMMGNNIFDFSSDSDFTAKLMRKDLGYAMDSAKL